MNPVECRHRFLTSPVAVLGTVGATGPHLVPVVFAGDGDRLFTAVDHKPKRTVRLHRLANIAENPAVSLVVQTYSDDWDELWWVRADGMARVIDDPAAMQDGIDLLVRRYPQYQETRPQGPVIEISVTRWSGWAAQPAG
jgi:PPOX class probable F420-dependent enzyme